MASRPPPDGTETKDNVDPLGMAGVVVRQHPRLLWTDSAGPHEHAVDARSVLGSGEGVDIQVVDPTVSRLHVEFEIAPDGLWVRDLGSKNGTFVQGLRVGSARVPDGATVRVGTTDLTVRYTRMPTPVKLWPSESFGPLLGRSVAMRELFAQIARVAALDSTVLIAGETGTGKELVARAIHEASPRAGEPFVVVDCGALPESLLEAELFGHAKGAFTGAVAARVGAFEAASGGTIFLDEVGELPLAIQPKLLRVLEARTVRRLGETAPRAVDIRVVSATHRDLRTQVNQGAFREDLYFRLAVLPLVVPPLRARRDDIPLLVSRFLAHGPGGAIDPETLRELAGRAWPGNVRELRNFVERAIAFGADEALALSAAVGGGRGVPPPPGGSDVALTLADARSRWAERTDAMEREYIIALLAQHGHNVSAAAAAAGVNRTYLHRLIRRHAV